MFASLIILGFGVGFAAGGFLCMHYLEKLIKEIEKKP